MSRVYAWLVDRVVPAGLRPRVHGLFDRFVEGLQSLRSPRELALIFLSSTLIWLGETTKYWFVMWAFYPAMYAPFTVLMLMTAVVNLFTTLPSTPGYVGTFDAPGIAILTAYGVPKAVAAGYTLVLHIALWLPITLLGQYRFLAPDSMLRPYAGAGVTYVKHYKAQSTAALSVLTGGTPANPTTIEIKSKFAATVQLGASFAIDKRWFVDANVMHTFLKTRATLSTGQTLDMKVDPNSFSLAVGYTF